MGYYSRIIDLQNLQRAWQKVYANRPAAGSDNISAEQFEQKKKEYLYQLHVELKTGRYMPQVVKQIEVCKNSKNRTIALFCMRDKVVQQSICTVIGGAIEQKISSRAFAYRNGKSAMAGVNEIEEVMRKQDFQWFLKMDIEKYFDMVDIERCLDDVRSFTKEEEVIRLIGACMRDPYYSSDGTIKTKIKGLYQGSAISPMLSNLYLKNFDDFMEKNTEHYIRYSDDMLVLGKDFRHLERLQKMAKSELETLGLKLKDSKTTIVSVQEGIEFLGIRLTNKGKEIPRKAEVRLKEKLEDVWFSDEWKIEEKQKRGSEILEGWEQDYNMDREIGDIIEYAIVLAHGIQQKDQFLVQTLKKQRKQYENIYRENVFYFTNVWKKLEEPDLVIYEYEQFFQLEKMDKEKSWREEGDKKRGIAIFEKVIVREDTENLTELMQLYVDMHMYNKAQYISERMRCIEYETKDVPTDVMEIENEQKADIETISLNATEMQLYIRRFVGREDTYGVATVKLNEKYSFEQVKHPFSEEVLEQHLLGNQTVASYI